MAHFPSVGSRPPSSGYNYPPPGYSRPPSYPSGPMNTFNPTYPGSIGGPMIPIPSIGPSLPASFQAIPPPPFSFVPPSRPPSFSPPSFRPPPSFDSNPLPGRIERFIPPSIPPGPTPSWATPPSISPHLAPSYSSISSLTGSSPSAYSLNPPSFRSPSPLAFPTPSSSFSLPPTFSPSSFKGPSFSQPSSLSGRTHYVSSFTPISQGISLRNPEITVWAQTSSFARSPFPSDISGRVPGNFSFSHRPVFLPVEDHKQFQSSIRRQLEETKKIMSLMDAGPERPFPVWGTVGVSQFVVQINPSTTLFIDPAAVTEFFHRASESQKWAVQSQLVQFMKRREVHDLDEGRLSTMQHVNNFVVKALRNPRVQGSLQIMGGAAEISAGCGITWGTGFLAAPIGHVVIVHGIDNVTTGFYSVVTGKFKNTGTQLALETVGIPSKIAGPVDAALGFAGMATGTKVAFQLITFPKYKLPPPILTDSYNLVASEEFKVILRTQMEKPYVVNAKLREFMDDIYRADASIGSGSTAAAIRHEFATGEMVGGKFHFQKGKDMITCLERWLQNNPTANLGDRAAAENVIKDLREALGE